jgi:hypothetical protein
MSNESKMFSATGLWKQQSKNGKNVLEWVAWWRACSDFSE